MQRCGRAYLWGNLLRLKFSDVYDDHLALKLGNRAKPTLTLVCTENGANNHEYPCDQTSGWNCIASRYSQHSLDFLGHLPSSCPNFHMRLISII